MSPCRSSCRGPGPFSPPPTSRTPSHAPVFHTLQISGNFKPKSTIMPVGLDPDLLPITNFTYTKAEDLTSMQIFQKSVYSAALYARLYN